MRSQEILYPGWGRPSSEAKQIFNNLKDLALFFILQLQYLILLFPTYIDVKNYFFEFATHVDIEHGISDFKTQSKNFGIKTWNFGGMECNANCSEWHV